MTDEELIELLRRMSPRLDILDCESVLSAADRIEALGAEQAVVIREAALREAYEVVYKWWFGDGNALPQELILALIGEKK